MSLPDIDPSKFRPEGVGEYVLAVERTRDVWGDLLGMREWVPERQREHAGRLLQVTLRHNGRLVGHVRMRLGRAPGAALVAEQECLHLVPEHRGDFLAMKLSHFAQRVCRMLGAQEIRANSKLNNNADALRAAWASAQGNRP